MKKKKTANRQEVVCDYIYDNYVQFSRLRHDVISNKVQIKDSRPLSAISDQPAESSKLNAESSDFWRDITTNDINDSSDGR